jgi:alkanesulfonate monooxygenase SsuD/methylene tetrahydromethanopterin reductase-like flavin-dependent oxidoreductase (luciferase family)
MTAASAARYRTPAMRVGIGLPNAIPGTEGPALLDWARRADGGPFTSLGVLDRVAYDCHEPLATLAAAAAVTERATLVTMVVIGPLRNTTLLAKQASLVHEVSGGRLVLGLSVGAREEDYRAAGVDPRERGRKLDEQLEDLQDAWEARDGSLGPKILVGGLSDRAHARMARYAEGYVHNGGPPRAFARAADRARAAWADLSRPGKPELWGQSYFVLGEDDRGLAYMRDYYAFVGPFAEKIAEGLLRTPQQIAGQVRGYAEAGCDELVLLPAVADLEQVDRLAEVVAAL